jgi:uncharacterized membrane protein
MSLGAPSAGGMTDESLASLRVYPPAPRNAFEKAMREARRWNMQAWREVNEERYAVEAWDSEAAESLDQRSLRRELLAADRSGSLRRARLATQQAATLARTPQERYRAALLLTKLSGEAGHYAAALAEAQRLVALAPRSEDSFRMLRQAAQFNGMTSLERHADAALKALQDPQFAVRKFSIR